MSLLEKIFGNYSEKELKKINPIVDKVESYDSAMQALSDEELRAKTDEFKARLANGETLDDLLPEAFAAVREDEAFQGTVNRRSCFAPGTYFGDENRRRKNACSRYAGIS